MAPGELVRCKVWGKVGIIITPPRSPGALRGPGKLVRVLWSGGAEPTIEHINNVEIINEAG